MHSVTPGAIAVFVKTPGLSDVKTRLAKGIGQKTAEKFYTLSLKATEAIVSQAVKLSGRLTAYWAIAEKQGMADTIWNHFNRIDRRIYQGRGDLGERLNRIYSELLKQHDFVILMGADSPHITVNQLLKPVVMFGTTCFVLGPTRDGGFYLFGGNQHIPKEIWKKVPYSHSSTFIKLKKNLEKLGITQTLKPSFDIDTVDDLKQLALQKSPEFLREQKDIVRFTLNSTIHFASNSKKDSVS